MTVVVVEIDLDQAESIRGGQNFVVVDCNRIIRKGDIVHIKNEVNDYNLVGEVTSYSTRFMSEGKQAISFEVRPISYLQVLELTEKEKAILSIALSHMKLYSMSQRDTANTIWEIIHELLGHDISDEDLDWIYNHLKED